MKLDRTDRKILSALQADGRLTVVEMSAQVGLSETPCARRLRALENEGVIEGYCALLNPSRIGLHVQTFIQIKLQQHADEIVTTFKRELAKFDEVVACYSVTGPSDFLIHVVVPDLETLNTVVLKKLLKIPGVHDVQSSIALEIVKRSVKLPLSHLPTAS